MNKWKNKKYFFLSLAIVIGISLIVTVIARNSFAVTYVCPDGFSPIDGTNGAMCQRSADTTYSCAEGEPQGDKGLLCYITKPKVTETIEDTINATFKEYKCSSGSVSGSTCVDYTGKEYYCSSGKLSGTKCEHSERMNVSSCTGTCSNYSSDGGTTTCLCSYSTAARKKCPSGYTESTSESNMCQKTLGNATAYYTCNGNDGTTSSTCTVERTVTKCPDGYTVIAGTNDTMCEKTVNATPKPTCLAENGGGSLNSSTNKCEIAANPVGDETNCPIGSTPSGDTCVCNTAGMNYNSATNKCEGDAYAFNVERPASTAFTAWCQSNGGSIQTVDTVNNIVKCVKQKDCPIGSTPSGNTCVCNTAGMIYNSATNKCEGDAYAFDVERPSTSEFTAWCQSNGGSIQTVDTVNNIVKCVEPKDCPTDSTKSGNTCVCNKAGMIYNSATNKCEGDAYAFDVERPSTSEFTAWCQSNGGSIQTVDTVNNIIKCVKWKTNTEYPDSPEFRQWCSNNGGSVQSVSGTNLVRCYSNKSCGTNASWNNLTGQCVCNPGWSGNPVTGCTTNVSSENKANYDDGEERCIDGYHENANGVCVQDSDYTSSGVYYMVGGTCKPYPAFDGYCIEKGSPYSSDGSCTTLTGESSQISLTCEQIASAYIAQNSSSKDYAAQSVLNGRTYYTDSNCTNAISTSSIRNQAQELCKTINFGTPQVTASGTNYDGKTILRGDSKFLNLVPINESKAVKMSLDGTSYSMKKGSTMCIPDNSGMLSKYTIKTSGTGNATAQIKGEELCITAGDKDGTTTFTLSRNVTSSITNTTKTLVPRICYNSYYQNYIQDFVETTSDEEIPSYSVVTMSLRVMVSDETVDLKGGFKLIKKNSEGNALEGVEFLIGTSVKNGEIVNPTTKTTDTNGEILLENLEAGQTYYYQEKKTLDGYILDEEIRSLVVEYDKIIEVELINYQKDKGGFRILKIDNFGNPLKNVKFKVGTDLNGTEGNDWNYMTTGEKGIIIVGDLDVNTKYYYQEVQAPDGYYLESTIREITIDSTEIVDIKIVNEKYTRDVTIRKISEDEKPLEGAVIAIYNADDNRLIETGITNKDGIIEFHNLSYGNYYALEKEAPKGYELNNNKHEFTITDLTQSINIPMKNYKINNPITADLPIIIVVAIGIIGISYGIYKYRTIKLNKEK